MLAVATPSARSLADAIDQANYARLLGLPRGRPLEPLVAALARGAQEWYVEHGRPFVAARRVAIQAIDPEAVTLASGHVFRCRNLADRLREAAAGALAAVAVTAGPEAEAESRRLWQDRPDEAFFLDRFAVAVTESLVPWASVWVCRRAETRGETALPHLSPGCGGWALEDQPLLMGALTDGQTDGIGPLRLLESGMLTPSNSLLAAVGLTRRAVSASPEDACRSCDLSPCRFRRAPFRSAA